MEDSQTRKLLRQFCQSGLSAESLKQLKEKVECHSPSLLPLVNHLAPVSDVEHVQCPKQWIDFVKSLASASPVCALVRPHQDVFNLLAKLTTGIDDMRRSTSAMSSLQREIPALFKLISSIPGISTRILTPILKELESKASAPFVDAPPNDSAPSGTSSLNEDNSQLSFFLSLPCVRPRNHYCADRQSQQKIVCTKNSSGHPSLLPGIFTLYCPHRTYVSCYMHKS